MVCLRTWVAALAVAALAAPPSVRAQQSSLDRVLAFPDPIPPEELHTDRGAAGAWHRIRKLATTASLLHVTAHPDDEHSGMLTLASRGRGARTALLSLNRGEAGANAIGPELFDGLGLIRTRELVLSGRYYGLDDLYFTTAVDYGYSKTVEETFRSWDREAVLEDMVRVIRVNRPIVVVSRFHGSRRDGHGNHHAAGVLTPEAVAAAADPGRFPEQITRERLRPWRVPRLFRGGVRVGEPYQVAVDANGYSPALGMTYQRWASMGLSLQRSQTSGRMRRGGGQVYWYEEVGSDRRDEAQVADDFFAGLDTRLPGLPGLLGEEVGDAVAGRLAEVQDAIDRVARDFDFAAPEASVAGLARGLSLLRAVTGGAGVPVETAFHLAVKERQFEDAIVAAAGVEVLAELDAGAGGAVVVPGEVVGVAVRVESAIPGRVELVEARVVPGGGEPVAVSLDGPSEVRVPADAWTARPYFHRGGLAENHYQVSDSVDLHMPWRSPRFFVELELAVDGVEVVRTQPVVGMVPNLPFGSLARRVAVLPAVSVSVSPVVRVVPLASDGGTGESAGRAIEVLVRMEANAPDVTVEGEVELPAGWTATPTSVRHDFRSRGEVVEASFSISTVPGWSGDGVVDAVARATLGGTTREYRAGYQTIEHRDLPPARLWHAARTLARPIAVAPLDGVTVGYVMGVGDEVPAAIEALGASVRLLGEADLTGGALEGFDAIVVGTRAYAVRRDLVDNNQRLLDYARGGGNLVVLYQTQEFVPGEMAPYPASLPRGAEEVSEEDAPVELLEPDHPLLASPNRISGDDFDGWLEQRGSKFFTDWDPPYTPLVETHDTGQAPQRGVWLTAEVGAGRYSYLALALHRQLPYGVPGAYRILSNVLWPRAAGR
ncbi:MAG: PIG-L family deacetylase [Gemmatimonadota bacterium]|nr:PIG-L family deacetylase [Gemmatimonadota bacterium]MDE2866119.1 PIG-L family deacetylase [Gemmatimonadota bacterium]